jgi:protease PrsW
MNDLFVRMSRFLLAAIALPLLFLAIANISGIAFLLFFATILHYTPWILTILPGLLISIFIYYRDQQEQEPCRYLVKAFVLGVISTYFAIQMEKYWIYSWGFLPMGDWSSSFIFAFGVVAVSEELVKFLILRFFLVSKKEFDEPLDGIVYAVMVAMGFATAENVLYVIERGGGVSVALTRMFTAVPAHAAFAVQMGYFMGLYKFTAHRAWAMLFLAFSLLVPVISHGFYDFFIFQKMNSAMVGFTFVILWLSIIMGLKLIKSHKAKSTLFLAQSQETH